MRANVSNCIQIELIPMTESLVSSDYVDWLNDKEINKYLECRFYEHTLESVKTYVKSLEGTNSKLYAIFCAESDKHIGNIKLNINPDHLLADVGLVIGNKKYWGKGVATRAIEIITDIARDYKLEKLKAGCYASNIGSLRAFEKVGFIQEAVLKSHYFNSDGQREDVILLGKFLGK
jgi:ribosomal-protein-alanine N-acetyltransferase